MIAENNEYKMTNNKIARPILTGQTDYRLIYMHAMYIEYQSLLQRKLFTQEEFDQKVEELENQAISIWGTTSLFYTFINNYKHEEL
jgi:hypothetical protein